MSTLWLISGLLENAGIRHGFSTRLAGSAGDRDAVARMAEHAGVEPVDGNFFVTGNQVHGDAIHVVTPQNRAERPDCDALMTCEPGIPIGVLTADCVPILIASVTDDRPVVAAVHSGWRGTAAGIAAKAVTAACELAGCEAADLIVALGPSIGGVSYEVSEDVARAVAATLPSHASGVIDRNRGPKPHVDLRGAVRLQLLAAGARADHIELVGGDTFTEPALYFSYRRDGSNAGRHLSFVSL